MKEQSHVSVAAFFCEEELKQDTSEKDAGLKDIRDIRLKGHRKQDYLLLREQYTGNALMIAS